MNERILHEDQIGQVSNELDSLINRAILEYDLPCASIVGLLQMKVIELSTSSQDAAAHSNDDDEPYVADD